MARKLGLSLLAVGAVAVLVAAAAAAPQRESMRGGTLWLMWKTEPASLDPAFPGGGRGAGVLLDATCAKLFTTVRNRDTGRLRVVREVVRSSTRSKDDFTYTFELKRTFRFYTGAPVNARSFAAAFDRTASSVPISPGRRFLEEIVGADAAMQGTATTISGVRVLGPYRLRIRLVRPALDFVARLTMPYFCPIPPGTPLHQVEYLPGSGPYYIADRVPNRRIVLERNPYYGGGRTADPNRIVWAIEVDDSERLRATRRGVNDYLPLFSQPDQVVRDLVREHGVNRRGGQVLRDVPTSSSHVFRFNLGRSVFAGPGQAPLRKAINYALDRQALADAHPFRTVSPSDRLLPAALRTPRSLYPLRPNRLLAQRWLARAAERPTTLTLYMWDFPGFGFRVAETFAANLRPFGIEVDVKYFDLDALGKRVATPGEPWDVAWGAWGAPYPDPAAALAPLLKGPKYEARMIAANQLSGTARDKAWADLEAELMLDDPPLAAYADFTPLAFVSRKNFGCWSGADAHLDLAAVCTK